MPTRRAVLAAATVSAAAVATSAYTAGPASAAPGRPDDLLYIGTWGSGQVHAVRFDPVRGVMTPLGPVAEASANWVAVHPTRPVLYVAAGELGGAIRAFRIDDASGALRQTGEITTQEAPGAAGGLSYIGLTEDAGALLVADFSTGSALTVALGARGGLGTVTSRVYDTGSGPSPRQAGPHPHHVVVAPGGRYALIADFGADRVFVHDYDRARHRITSGVPRTSFATAAGSGPRRLAFHPDGRTAYLLDELTADLQTLRWDPRSATLTSRQLLTTNAPGHTGTTSAAELALSHDGRHVYTSNRGDNALVVFATDPVTGLLREVQRLPCAGTTPWSLTLHPDGRWMFVANQASGAVALFRIDPRSGRLTDTGASVAVPSPDCIGVRTRPGTATPARS